MSADINMSISDLYQALGKIGKNRVVVSSVRTIAFLDRLYDEATRTRGSPEDQPPEDWPCHLVSQVLNGLSLTEMARLIEDLGLADRVTPDEYWQLTPRDILFDALETWLSDGLRMAFRVNPWLIWEENQHG